MMPIADDYEGYERGHFRKVYDSLIKPSIIEAGFTPVRADELTNQENLQTEVIQRLINSPLVVCDLSSLDKQISLGLGIRQWFKKPTVLLWDDITPKAYYINGITCIEYSNTLNKKSISEVRKKIKASVQTIFFDSGC